MFQTGLHVHNDHVVLAEHQAGQQRLEHHMLGAHAAGAAGVHGAHDQQLDAVDVLGQFVGQIRDLRIELVEGVAGVGSGTLPGQFLHFGDGDDGIDLLLRQTQGQAQVGVGVHIGGKHRAPLVGIEPGKGGREGGFTHTALAGNSDFHDETSFNSCKVRG